MNAGGNTSSSPSPKGDVFVTTRWTVVLSAGRKGYLMIGEKAIPYAEAAQNLVMDEGAVRVAVHRLRKRYRELLRGEIAQTLDDPAHVADELRALQAAVAS